jgi:hypothetical protein
MYHLHQVYSLICHLCSKRFATRIDHSAISKNVWLVTREMLGARLAGGLALVFSLVACGGNDQPPHPLTAVAGTPHAAIAGMGVSLHTTHAMVQPRLQGGNGLTSRTQTNGRVAAVVDSWTSVGKTEFLTSYIVYSFVSEGVINTGSIAGGATTSEIWRFSSAGGGTWCPVITNLPLSIASATPTLNSVSSTNGSVSIRLATGSGDGVLGLISFNDSNPNAESCAAVASEIKPLDLNNGFYTALSQHQFSVPISHIKTIPIDESAIPPDARRYQNTMYLISWGGTACAGADWVNDSDGTCSLDTTNLPLITAFQNGRPLGVGAYLANDRRESPEAVNRVTDLDALINANADGSLTYRFALGFADDTNAPKALLRTATGQLQQFSWPYLPPLSWIEPVLPSLVSQSQAQQVFLNPLNQVQLKYSDLQVTGTQGAAVTCPMNGGACSLQPNAKGANTAIFSSALARVDRANVPDSVLSAWQLDPAALSIDMLPVWSGAQAPSLVMSYFNRSLGESSNALTLPTDFAASSPSNASLNGLTLRNARVFLTSSEQKGQLRMHHLAQFDDYSGFDQDQAQHRNVHGGVYYCALDIATPSGRLNVVDRMGIDRCASLPRLGTADGVGYAVATARNIIKGASYLASPSMVNSTVSPNGVVVLTYVSRAGAIAHINASEPGTDWSSPRSWVSISAGRSAECNAALHIDPPPKPEPHEGFWGKALAKMGTQVLVEVMGELVGGPALSIATGQLADLVISHSDYVANEKAKKTRDAQWLQVYKSASLSSVCTLN